LLLAFEVFHQEMENNEDLEGQLASRPVKGALLAASILGNPQPTNAFGNQFAANDIASIAQRTQGELMQSMFGDESTPHQPAKIATTSDAIVPQPNPRRTTSLAKQISDLDSMLASVAVNAGRSALNLFYGDTSKAVAIPSSSSLETPAAAFAVLIPSKTVFNASTLPNHVPPHRPATEAEIQRIIENTSNTFVTAFSPTSKAPVPLLIRPANALSSTYTPAYTPPSGNVFVPSTWATWSNKGNQLAFLTTTNLHPVEHLNAPLVLTKIRDEVDGWLGDNDDAFSDGDRISVDSIFQPLVCFKNAPTIQELEDLPKPELIRSFYEFETKGFQDMSVEQQIQYTMRTEIQRHQIALENTLITRKDERVVNNIKAMETHLKRSVELTGELGFRAYQQFQQVKFLLGVHIDVQHVQANDHGFIEMDGYLSSPVIDAIALNFNDRDLSMVFNRFAGFGQAYEIPAERILLQMVGVLVEHASGHLFKPVGYDNALYNVIQTSLDAIAAPQQQQPIDTLTLYTNDVVAPAVAANMQLDPSILGKSPVTLASAELRQFTRTLLVVARHKHQEVKASTNPVDKVIARKFGSMITDLDTVLQQSKTDDAVAMVWGYWNDVYVLIDMSNVLGRLTFEPGDENNAVTKVMEQYKSIAFDRTNPSAPSISLHGVVMDSQKAELFFSVFYIQAVLEVINDEAAKFSTGVAHLQHADDKTFANNAVAIYCANTIEHIVKTDLPAIVAEAVIEVGRGFAPYKDMDQTSVPQLMVNWVSGVRAEMSPVFGGMEMFIFDIQVQQEVDALAKLKYHGTPEMYAKNNIHAATLTRLGTAGVENPLTIAEAFPAFINLATSEATTATAIHKVTKFAKYVNANSWTAWLKNIVEKAVYGVCIVGGVVVAGAVAGWQNIAKFTWTLVSTVFRFVITSTAKAVLYTTTGSLKLLMRGLGFAVQRTKTANTSQKIRSSLVLPAYKLVVTNAWFEFFHS
jgi:hypothetical protein